MSERIAANEPVEILATANQRGLFTLSVGRRRCDMQQKLSCYWKKTSLSQLKVLLLRIKSLSVGRQEVRYATKVCFYLKLPLEVKDFATASTSHSLIGR
jgi:hypothetical protein